jgi:hypothetical protein
MLDACRSSTPFSPAQKRLWLDGRHRALLRKRPRFTAPQSVGLVTIGACFSALGSYTRAGNDRRWSPSPLNPSKRRRRILGCSWPVSHSVLADTKRSRTGNHQRRADQGSVKHGSSSSAGTNKINSLWLWSRDALNTCQHSVSTHTGHAREATAHRHRLW